MKIDIENYENLTPEEKIAALKSEMAGLKGEEKRSVLLKIQELTREKQTAGRKE